MAGLDYCFKSNNDYLKFRDNNRDIIIQKEFDSELLRTIIKSPDNYLDNAKILKDSRTTKAGITTVDNNKIFIKRYNNKGMLFTLRYMFRKTHALRAWQAAWLLQRWQVPTPANFAVITTKQLGTFINTSYLITDVVENPIGTLDFFKIMLADKNILLDFIDKITKYLVPLHCLGMRHLDFKLSNIYSKKNGDAYSYGLWDLDGIIMTNKPLTTAERSMDIARLFASFCEVSKQTDVEIVEDEIKKLISDAYLDASGFNLDQNILEEKKLYFIKKREKRLHKA